MKLCIYLFIYFIYKNLAAAEIVTQNVKVLSRKIQFDGIHVYGKLWWKISICFGVWQIKDFFKDFDCHTILNLQRKKGWGESENRLSPFNVNSNPYFEFYTKQMSIRFSLPYTCGFCSGHIIYDVLVSQLSIANKDVFLRTIVTFK